MNAKRAPRALLLLWLPLVGCGGAVAPRGGGQDAGTDAPGASGDDSAATCTIDGYFCAQNGDCCAGVCKEGVCGPVPACKLDTSSCGSADECCSRVCESSFCGGMAPAQPGGSCKAEGEACGRASDCCDGACTVGRCGASSCSPGSSTCDTCLGASCCAQVMVCRGDPACAPFIACLVSCEKGGKSAFDCMQGDCKQYDDTSVAQVFACGDASCHAECSYP